MALTLKEVREHAKIARENPGPCERLVYDELSARGVMHAFRPQHVIHPFYVDLYHPRSKTAIEIDGSVHAPLKARQHDWGRSQMLARKGIRVIRFSNRAVASDVRGVVDSILRQCPARAKKAS